jgi:hypothetical protein
VLGPGSSRRLLGGCWAGGQARPLPADLAGQTGGMEGDQLAAVAGADPAQNQLGVGPDLARGRARPPAVTGRAQKGCPPGSGGGWPAWAGSK